MDSYLNCASLAWGSTQKNKFSTLYHQQKHSIRLLSFKDQFTHARPLFKEIDALNINEKNIFNVSCLNAKTKHVPKLSKIYLP